MARRFKFCVNCRRTITDSEVRRDLYVDSPQGMLCATCAQQLDEAHEPEPATRARPARRDAGAAKAPARTRPVARQPVDDAGGKHLEAIREQVESIHRTLLFEKTSPWNVIAAVSQCLAIGMLLVAALQWLEGEGTVLNVLLVTIVFQLMALTFFIKAR